MSIRLAFKPYPVIPVLCLFFLLNNRLYGQKQPETEQIIIGQPCPHFLLGDLHYFNKKTLTSEDLKGRPAILDFFASHCAACFESFPKINTLENKYAGQLQIILVGDYDKIIKQIYEKFQARYHLNLPVAYDSLLFKRFQIATVPYEVWLDENGIVRAVTGSAELTDSNVQVLVSHGPLNTRLAKNLPQYEEDKMLFDYRKPLLVNGNGGNDSEFLYRSLLAKWRPDQDVIYPSNIYHQYGNMFQAVGVPLFSLYQLAYGDTVNSFLPPEPGTDASPNHYGKWSTQPTLMIKDSSLFQYNYRRSENLFDYSVIVDPQKASALYLQRVMRNDLSNYFGYKVSVSKKSTVYWKLISIKRLRKSLISNGDSTYKQITYAGFTLKNVAMKDLISIIANTYSSKIIEDKTGIHQNIDLQINAIRIDFNDLKKALKEKGLELIKSHKRAKTIIISNPYKSS